MSGHVSLGEKIACGGPDAVLLKATFLSENKIICLEDSLSESKGKMFAEGR